MKKFFLFFFFILFLFLPLKESKGALFLVCEKRVPLGQMAKRILEIRDELVIYYTILQTHGSKILQVANEIRTLLKDKCPPIGCLPTECQDELCKAKKNLFGKWEIKCPLGKPCQNPPGKGGSLCPPEIEEQIREKLKEMKKISEDFKEVFRKATSLILELKVGPNSWLAKLKKAKKDLEKALEDEKVFVLSCPEARAMGYQEKVNFLGLTLFKRRVICHDLKIPLLKILIRRDPLDYYICPKPL